MKLSVGFKFHAVLGSHLGYQSSCHDITELVCKFTFFLSSGTKFQEMAWICQGNPQKDSHSEEVNVLSKEIQW